MLLNITELSVTFIQNGDVGRWVIQGVCSGMWVIQSGNAGGRVIQGGNAGGRVIQGGYDWQVMSKYARGLCC